jgi:hypothetical protein
MSPPLVCPQLPDCPLYDQRLSYGSDEPLRRAILMERHRAPGLVDLIRAEQARPDLPRPALPPGPPPGAPSILDQLTKEVQ